LRGSESSQRFTEPPLWPERPIVTRANIFGSPWFGRAFFSYFALRSALLLHFFVFFFTQKIKHSQPPREGLNTGIVKLQLGLNLSGFPRTIVTQYIFGTIALKHTEQLYDFSSV
jgi:hypothetical protein